METLLALMLGVGLAAACGLRVFLPLLVASAAALAGHVQLGEGFAWLGSEVALAVLGVATVVEVAGYHVPWLDNLLDTLAVPAAAAAGTLLVGAVLGDVSPVVRGVLALVAGGGVGGGVAGGMAAARAASTALTGGLANPVIALVETLAAGVLVLVTLLLPVLGVALVAGAAVWTGRRLRRARATLAGAPPTA